MKALILGGTGSIGTHLVQHLSNNNIETFVTSRRNIEPKGKEYYIRGDAQDNAFLRTILNEHWDVIVDFMSYNTQDFKSRVNLLLNATSQYVFLSSARVYADSERPITESSPLLLEVSNDKEFLSTDEYALAKARQENVLRTSTFKNWTIIRPYITYSENRLQLGVLEKEDWLYRALHCRTIVFSSDINSKLTTLTYGLDVSKGIMSIIGSPFALGETFTITTDKSYTWKDIFTIYIDVLENYFNHKPKILYLDTEKFIECHHSKYQILYDRLFNRQFDNSKILSHLTSNDFTSINAGLKNCLEKFLKHPNFRYINWKTEAFKDRQTKEYTPIKEIRGLKHKMKYLVYRYLVHPT